MGRKIKRKFVALVLAICTVFLISCDNSDGALEPLVEGAKLEQGAIILYNNGEYSNLSLVENKYTKVKTDGVIINYNYESDRYIYLKDNKHYVFYDGKIEEINEKQYDYIKISPSGKYLSYFVENEGLQLKVKEIGSDKKIEFKSEVAISGEMLDWLDENRLVYYGVDVNGNNGLFTYNIENNEEKLVYKLDEGFIQFLKSTHTGVVFLQEHNDKGLILKKFNSDTNKVDVLTEDIQKISDIVERDNKIYLLGKVKNDMYSLYRVDGAKVTRLIYDFPKIVKEDKKLSIDKMGNILFVGTTTDMDKEEVYEFSSDGTIRSLILNSNEYIFVQ